MKTKSLVKIIVLSVVALLVLLCAVVYIFVAIELNKTFERYSYPQKNLSPYYRYEDYAQNHPRTSVTFKSGKNTLHGWVYCPQNTKGLIVFAHGIECAHESYINLLIPLLDRGYRLFTYDATGCGESEGKGAISLSQSALDLHNALLYVEQDAELSSLPVFVLGHSWGGYASAAVLNFGHKVNAVVSLSGYDNPYKELVEQCTAMYGEVGKLLNPFIWVYTKVTAKKYSELSAVNGINSTTAPVLVLHATDDGIIFFDGEAIIAKKDKITNPNVSYHVIDDPLFNDHASYFNTPEFMDYKKNVITPGERALYEKYGSRQNVPQSAFVEFYASLDKELCNGLNQDLLNLIDGFFTNAL